MPGIDKQYFEKYIKNFDKNFFDKYPTFIETGTHKGGTTVKMAELFKNVETIEINQDFYNFNLRENSHLKNINFHLGDSGKILKEIIKNVNTNAIFFIDAHGRYKVNGALGEKDVPLYEELTAINELFKKESIIIIDDFRLFGQKKNNCDWSDIKKEEALKLLENRTIEYYHGPSERRNDDRLIIFLRSI